MEKPMRLLMRDTFLFPALILATVASMHAQTGPTRSFDVASVRRSEPSTRVSHRVTDTRVDLVKIELRQLLWMAYEIDPLCCRDRLSGAESLAGVLFDVHATIPAGSTRAQVPEMLKSLLIQRFGLRTHVEPRPTDVYELVVGKDGIRMKEVEAANDLDKEVPGERTLRVSESDQETVSGRIRTINGPRRMTRITARTMYDRIITGRVQQIEAVRMTMAELASVLSANTGRFVLDKTNLTGVYSFSLELPIDAYIVQLNALTQSRTGGTTNVEPTGVSALKAVEQLGLRVEARRISMDTTVIDHIDRVPSEN